MSAVPSQIGLVAAPSVASSKLTALEALRGFAALYVFLHHLRLAPNSGLGALLYFGQEAVILFFLLSGFVIYYSTHGRRFTTWQYFKLRFRRIYPIFGVALLLAYAAACAEAGGLAAPRWGWLLANVFMLQDVSALKPGVMFDTYYGNSPLWSLSYEWWFYMAFIPLGLWAAERSRLNAVFAISLAGAVTYGLLPNQFSLFAGYLLIWWSGLELAREYVATGAVSFAKQRKLLGMLLAVSVVWLAPLLAHRPERLSLGISPILHVRHFLTAAVFILLTIAWGRVRYRGFGAVLGPFAVLAPVSYFVYATHEPILNIAHALGLFSTAWVGVAASLGAAIALGWVVEVRLQSRINRLIR